MRDFGIVEMDRNSVRKTIFLQPSTFTRLMAQSTPPAMVHRADGWLAMHPPRLLYPGL